MRLGNGRFSKGSPLGTSRDIWQEMFRDHLRNIPVGGKSSKFKIMLAVSSGFKLEGPGVSFLQHLTYHKQ